MSKNKELIKAVITLCSLALVAGALLGLFYQITYITDEEREQRVIQNLQEIKLPGDINPDYKKIDFASDDTDLNNKIQNFFSDEELGIYAILAIGVNGYKDKIPMYVIIKDDTIIALEPGSIKETPGVSDAAFSDDYLNRFKISVYSSIFTEDSKITATGATRSSLGVLSSIKNAVNYYKAYLSQGNK